MDISFIDWIKCFCANKYEFSVLKWLYCDSYGCKGNYAHGMDYEVRQNNFGYTFMYDISLSQNMQTLLCFYLPYHVVVNSAIVFTPYPKGGDIFVLSHVINGDVFLHSYGRMWPNHRVISRIFKNVSVIALYYVCLSLCYIGRIQETVITWVSVVSYK